MRTKPYTLADVDAGTRRKMERVIVQELVLAAKREFARRKWPLTGTDGRTKIDKSFGCKVSKTEIRVWSSFPGIESFATGIPVTRDSEGKVIMYQGPVQMEDVWLHPKMGSRNFLHLGLDKGTERALQLMFDACFK